MYLEIGNWPQMRELVEKMYPVFVASELPTDTLAALMLFVESVRAESAEAGAARQLTARLEAARSALKRS